MRSLRCVVVALALTLTMSGCIAGDFSNEASGGPNGGESSQTAGTCVNYSAGGSPSGSKSFESPTGKASMSLSVGGSMSVEVKDGSGSSVYKASFSGGASEQKSLEGAPGTWSISVSGGGGFSGQICGS